MRIRQGFEERSRLGRLLVNRGYLTETQVEEGLRLQNKTGQRLGEVFIQSGWISQKELDRVLKHQSRYRNAAALVTMVTLPFQPLVSFAASNSANASQAFEAGELYTGEFHKGSGLSELTDDELAVVSGQGDSKLLARIAGVTAMPSAAAEGQDDQVDAIEGLKLTANVFVPMLNFLDSNLTISGVHFREGEGRYSIRDDGALVLAMPERIDEIRMDNIRVIGSAAPSLGNVSIHDIRFHPDSRMTIYTR
ncbi:pilus assembly protein PilB [Marinobacter salinexigens]|uniref:Pilus assembly protein PilB n=1 Tax=Marinobacter salinexigens TaxID=2919747 RepID=A0A5B0VIG6_9GAMM|nr:pilus assembly protein PilB [Marinobacter salinexigens]KAA1173925.1 pilus assembly protein PilB [Marinobacter salinexigens]